MASGERRGGFRTAPQRPAVRYHGGLSLFLLDHNSSGPSWNILIQAFRYCKSQRGRASI